MKTFTIDNTALYLYFKEREKPWIKWSYKIDEMFERRKADTLERLNAYLDGLETSKRDATAYTTTTFYEMPGTVRRDANGRFARKQQPTKEAAR